MVADELEALEDLQADAASTSCAAAGRARASGSAASATAETRNDTASIRIANGAEMNWTRAPARPGPPISAIEELVASLLLASTTRSVPTSDGT